MGQVHRQAPRRRFGPTAWPLLRTRSGRAPRRLGGVGSKDLQEGLGDDGGGLGHRDSGLPEGGDLGGGGGAFAIDDGPGVAHAASRRGGATGDKTRDRFLAVLLDPLGCFRLIHAPDLADQNDPFRIRVVVEHLEHVQVRQAVNRIAPDADTGRLADAPLGQLPDRFVGERAAARDDSDVALLVDVARGDADAAAAAGVLAAAGGDDAGAVRSQQSGLLAFHGALRLDHVLHRDELGDADDQIQFGIDRLEDGIGRHRGRNEHDRNGGSGLGGGLEAGIEDGDLVFEGLAALAGHHAGDNLGAILQAQPGVLRAEPARDALHHHLGRRRNENGHSWMRLGGRGWG